MKIDEEAPNIVEQAPDSQEESDDSPDKLSAEDRDQYQRGVAAVDEFLNDPRTARYRATDANREKLLGYLAEHDLPLSFGGLYVAFEQLSQGHELELNSEAENQPDEEQPDEQADASARLATAQLGARGTKSEDEPPEVEESEPDEIPEKEGRRVKPVAAWRNGRAIAGLGS